MPLELGKGKIFLCLNIIPCREYGGRAPCTTISWRWMIYFIHWPLAAWKEPSVPFEW